jgi:hypothetical protein
MNTLQKLTISVLLAGFTFGSTVAVQADVLKMAAKADALNFAIPTVAALTVEVGKGIAKEVGVQLRAQLRAALKAPRVSRSRQSPTVTVQPMETIVVVATRLPPIGEATVTRTAQVGSDLRL